MTRPLFVFDDTLGLHASVTHLPSLQVPLDTYFAAVLPALEPCGLSRVEDITKTLDDDDGLLGRFGRYFQRTRLRHRIDDSA